jgi:hypothetical protein
VNRLHTTCQKTRAFREVFTGKRLRLSVSIPSSHGLGLCRQLNGHLFGPTCNRAKVFIMTALTRSGHASALLKRFISTGHSISEFWPEKQPQTDEAV